MKVLIVGASGMLGHALFAALSEDSRYEVFASIRSTADTGGALFPVALRERLVPGVDAFELATVRLAIEQVRPDVVVNCVGLVKQGGLADRPLETITLNTLFPHQLAEMCSNVGARIIQISTDCVFDGVVGGYTEKDRCCPGDLYGRTKLLGELDGPDQLTLRTSIIGHELYGFRGLLEWFMAQQERVNGFTRAFFSGLTTVELARAIGNYVLTCPELCGVYHVSSTPITKYDLLKQVAVRYDLSIEVKAFDAFVIDRSLNSTRFKEATGYVAPSWDEMIDAMYVDFKASAYYVERQR